MNTMICFKETFRNNNRERESFVLSFSFHEPKCISVRVFSQSEDVCSFGCPDIDMELVPPLWSHDSKQSGFCRRAGGPSLQWGSSKEGLNMNSRADLQVPIACWQRFSEPNSSSVFGQNCSRLSLINLKIDKQQQVNYWCARQCWSNNWFLPAETGVWLLR